MDKYEYNVKSDQIKKLYSRKDFEAAAKIADEIDWYKVKDNTMINRVADIYENTKQYEKAKEVLLIAYERSPLGRQLAYKLTILALRTKNFVEADEFYQDFVEMSPSDVSQYLLKYRIAKAKGEDIDVLIQILEAYVDVEMDERWQYELAKLYHEADEDDKCIAMCDELILWFHDGKYVDKAKELKKLISGVIEEYNKRYAPKKVVPISDKIAEDSEWRESSGLESGAESFQSDINTHTEKMAEGNGLSRNEEVYREDMTFANEESDFDKREEERYTYSSSQQEESPSVEEQKALEVLRAVEEAAIEAQRAADMAKKLVEEAKLKVTVIREEAKRGRQGVGKNLSSDTRQGERDRFAGMSVGEIRKQLDKEELLYGDSESGNNDSTIEIFEFDKEKEGRVKNIGDELTKTAEIDIDEIKIKLNNQDDIYNTANIQAALAKSMEKLLEFSEDKKYSEVRNAFMDLKEEYEPEIGEELDVGQEELEVVSKQTAKQQKEEEVYPELIEEIKPEEEIYPEPIEEIKPEEEIYPEPIEEIKPEEEIYPEPIEEIRPQEIYPEPIEKIKPQEVYPEPIEEIRPQEIYPEPIEEIKPQEVYPEPIEEIKPQEVYPEPIEEIKSQEVYPEPIEEIKPQEVYPKPAEDIMRQEAVHTEAVSEKQPVLMEEIEPQKEVYPEPAVKAPRLQEEMYAEPIEEVKEPQEPIAEIHRTYEESIDKEQAVSKESAEQDLDSYLDDYPSGATKRINREEINRLLHEQRSMFQAETSSLSGKDENDKVSQAEEQIEGQMTMDEVLAGFHNKISDEDKTSKLEALKAEEKELANIETEDDMEEIEESSEVSEENNMWKVETPEEGNQWKTETPETAEEEKSSDVINLFEENEQIPEEYRAIFNDFVGTGSMEKDIAQTLDNLINNFAMDGTSRTNNVIVTGSAKIGKTTLGLGIIKAANKGRNRGGRRVAKVKASVLNKRGVALAMTQIIGTDLIIEQAGNLMPNTLVDLMIAMKNYTEEMLIVLEDDKAAIDRMLNNTPDMKEFFTNRLDIQEMEINDMVKIAKEYAAEQFYEIDEMGELALYAKLDDISGKNPVLSVEDIQEVIDEAIAHANRFGIGKLFGKIRKGKGDMGTLTEHDFL